VGITPARDRRVKVMEPPIGFIRLTEAVDALGLRLAPDADVAKLIAEACESGRVTAAYRTITGADELDRSVWRSPAWRNYFASGTIDLDLPLLDERLRPHPAGFTARCTREIFVRRDSLTSFIADLEPAPITAPKQLRNAPPDLIRREIRTVYLDPTNDQPNVAKLPKFVRSRLNPQGFDASDRQIIKIGGESEFAALRRKPGKTKASERPR
jgi:hypothetical protein